MNRLFIAFMMVCLTCQANCLWLENLCENSTFEYKGIEVNSFLQKKFNYTLPKVGEYAMDEAELNVVNSFTSQKDVDEFQSEVDKYHEYLVDLYSESFLNERENVTNILKEKEKVKNMKTKLDALTKKAIDKYQSNIAYQVRRLDKLNEFIDLIEIYSRNVLSGAVWRYDYFKSFIDGLDAKPNVETFVFKNEFLNKIYKKEIVQFEKFYFFKGSENYYDLKNSYGIIEVSVNLPFNTKEFRESECFDASSLPPFFANKTKA